MATVPSSAPKRQITTLTSGNVIVVTFGANGQHEQREYTRRGSFVYVLQDRGPKLPACVELKPNGAQLLVGRGETLEDTIRRTLDEADRSPRALTLYDVAFAITLFAGGVAALTALSAFGAAGLVVSARTLAMSGVAAALCVLLLASAGLRVLWHAFRPWRWLLLVVAALTVIAIGAYAGSLLSQPFNFIR